MRQDETFLRTRRINKTGVCVVMVEQNARRCLQICDRGYVLDQGRDAYTGTGRELANDPKVIAALPRHPGRGRRLQTDAATPQLPTRDVARRPATGHRWGHRVARGRGAGASTRMPSCVRSENAHRASHQARSPDAATRQKAPDLAVRGLRVELVSRVISHDSASTVEVRLFLLSASYW